MTADRQSPVVPQPVSVIIVVRNGAGYIADALGSVVAQTMRPAEILVVDGGSTDNTREIASGFAGVRVVPQASRGIAGAYNEGIALAGSGLIAFLSHDDTWLPDKLEKHSAFMAANPRLLASFTLVRHVLEPGASPPPGFRRELLDRPVPGFIMETLMARPEAFSVVGPFDTSFAVSEDTDWFARARDKGIATAVLDEVLTTKRVHDTNASLNAPQINGLLLRALRQSIGRKRSAADRA